MTTDRSPTRWSGRLEIKLETTRSRFGAVMNNKKDLTPITLEAVAAVEMVGRGANGVLSILI